MREESSSSAVSIASSTPMVRVQRAHARPARAAGAAAEDAHPALVEGSSDEDEPVLVDASLLVDASPCQPDFSLINVEDGIKRQRKRQREVTETTPPLVARVCAGAQSCPLGTGANLRLFIY